jgi:hypothetical protein
MELTNDHLEVAYSAWVAAQSGGGIALDDPVYTLAAHELAEQRLARAAVRHRAWGAELVVDECS